MLNADFVNFVREHLLCELPTYWGERVSEWDARQREIQWCITVWNGRDRSQGY